MFGIKNTETQKRKEDLAKKYVDKVSDHQYFQNDIEESINETKQGLNEIASVFKKEKEIQTVESRTKQDMEKFLLDNGLLSDFKKVFSSMILISEEGKNKISEAKDIIHSSQTEQEAVSKLNQQFEELGIEKIPENNNINEQQIDSQENEGYQEDEEIQKTIENLKTNEQYIVNQAKKYGITDSKQIAYILSTVKGECGFKNIKEIGGISRKYGKIDPQTGQSYYGRGFVQLTHKGNYEKFTEIIQEKNLKFKDNGGKELTSAQMNLVQNPDTILKSNELASFILIEGMKRGSFTGKKLSDFINNQKTDFYNARSIINGMSSSPDKFANRAKEYLRKIENKKLNNSILVGPELMAKKPNEFGGLGNSIMTGFQGYSSKKYFKNMDGIEGKSTQTHPNRFKSKEDVKNRKQSHPGVKSFVMYFGANTKNNTQTLKDLEQRSVWLKAEGIQPVLSTCIGEDNNTHLNELNPKILELGKKLNYPVLDFASQYIQDKSLFAMGNNKHPSGAGYDFMKDQILNSAA